MFLKLLFGRMMTKYLQIFLKVNDGNSFPEPLCAEEERECFKSAKEGNKSAREKLIVHNLRLVAHIIKKYYPNAKNQEDLMSIGTVGLIKAIDSFDVNNGAKFATYASRCLQNEILMYFRAQKKCGLEVSINETIESDKDGNPLTYIDIISTDDTIADDINEKIYSDKAKKIIKEKLDDRERKIIFLRYGLGYIEPLTQREISKKLGISRSYVSRIEKNALKKLKMYLLSD